MPKAQIVDVVNFMPERVVVNRDLVGDEITSVNSNPFFEGIEERRFASPDYSTVDLAARALGRLLERTGVRAESLDLLLCSCVLADELGSGTAPAIQHRVGARNATAMNFDTGCTSYLSGLGVARAFVEAGLYERVAVVTATNFISRLPEYQRKRQSWVLGDGASATLVARGDSSFAGAHERAHGEHCGILQVAPEAVGGVRKDYWQPGCGPLGVTFSIDMLETLQHNALTLLPDAVGRALAAAGLGPDDVSMLLTHQPSSHFIAEWRRRIGVGPPRVHDTLAKYGNLFQSSIPVTLADALELGKVRRGDVLALGSFSNGGDLVSALALRWV
ncbi:MAG TPA: 3-oxoacyl-ACP synthase III family protein [Polyangiaceae bacterium]|nr:3-oxoacyl-ACP synthase III family protein [Polyangiaceae bacterium]